ncbi:RNA-directed DNA polymerase [Tanacetum coccineum]
MKRVMFARFLLVDYEQTLYSLYQNCRQSTQTISEYAEEFMRLASRNQLSESDAQQVARFNNGLRYDIQAIVSLQTTWTIDEVVRIALKAEQTIKKQRTGSSMYKTKTYTNQSSNSQSGGDAQVDHSKSTLSMKLKWIRKKTTTTTTSTHVINKSSINPYARLVGNKCFKCQEVGHTSNQCRATKRVNLAEGDKAHSKSEDEGIIISPNVLYIEGR